MDSKNPAIWFQLGMLGDAIVLRRGTRRTLAVDSKSADGLSMTLSETVESHYFFFGTDNSGRDLLTRTLIAGRVSLAIGLLAASLGSPRAFTINAAVSLAVIVPLAIPLIRRRT